MHSCLVANRKNSKIYNMNTPSCQYEVGNTSEDTYQRMPTFIVNEVERNGLRRSSEMHKSDILLGKSNYTRVSRSNSELGAFMNAQSEDSKFGVTCIESQKHCDYTQAKTSVSTTPRKKGRLLNLTHKRKVAPMPQCSEKADVLAVTKSSTVNNVPDTIVPRSPYVAPENMTTIRLRDPILERPCSSSISKAESTASFNSWTDPDYLQEHIVVERLNQDIYERQFYGQEHDNYVGSDRFLGALCISLMGLEKSTYYEAIVRGKFLSVHLEIYPKELSQILTEIGYETKGSDQCSKKLALIGVLKCYIDYLRTSLMDFQALEKDACHKGCDSETEGLIDVKDGISLGSDKHLKWLVEKELICLRSKPNQTNLDSVSDAIRRLDLAMIRRAHYIDVPLADEEWNCTQDALKDILELTDIRESSIDSREKDINHLQPAQITSQDPEKRSWTIQELLSSESNYLGSLARLEKIFSWLQKDMRDNNNFHSVKFEISVIFGNISEIYQKHVEFAQDLKQRENDMETSIGEILHKNFKNFAKAYYHYLSNRSQAIRTHQKLISSNSQYKKFIEELEGPTYASDEKISLSSLLIEPVQRIPRYTMLIDEILKHTSLDHSDYINLLSAKVVANEIATLHETEEEKAARMLSYIIQKVKNCPSTLLKANRRVISHVDAQEIDILNGKAVRFVTIILFNNAIAVFKRASNSINGKSMFPGDKADSTTDRTLRRQNSALFPGSAANRYISNHDSISGFKYKSCVDLLNADVFIPRGSAVEQNDRLEDVFYIRTSEIPSDDDNYFSIGCLKQYVIGKNSNTCEPFSSLFQRNKAIHSIVSQSEQPAVLKRTLGPTDLYFCFQSKEQYENSRTKNPIALYFSPAASYSYTPPTAGKSFQGLVYIEKKDDAYRSVLSTTVATPSTSGDNEDESWNLLQTTDSLNEGSGSRYHRPRKFASLLFKQLIYMETAILCHRTVVNQESSYMLETLVERFSSKLQKSLQTSLHWRQNHISSAAMTPPKGFRLSLKASKKVSVASIAEHASETEKTITPVTSPLNGKKQPLVTPLEYLWDVRPIYETVAPSPYQKRQLAKPFTQRSIKSHSVNPTTDWNDLRLNNDSNISLASQMSTMSTMSSLSVFSTRSRMSTRSRISLSFPRARTKRLV